MGTSESLCCNNNVPKPVSAPDVIVSGTKRPEQPPIQQLPSAVDKKAATVDPEQPAKTTAKAAPEEKTSENVAQKDAGKGAKVAQAKAGGVGLGGVHFEFIDAKKNTVNIDFTKKPLGIEFENTVPLRVQSVKKGGVAEGMGVKPQWQLVKVDGTSLKNMELKAAKKILTEAVSGLAA